ncbi:MAG: metallophosphoesterase, partial [Clostridia bacterium]|nr:metallophosphoesterase [Clostridia bacterium]
PIRATFFADGVTDHETRVWRHMDQAVEVTKPDLIVLTGDNIYGEMDDSGTVWDELCTKMDSYEIPWLSVFGNHDNESAKGVQWQVDRLLDSEYCIFKQGTVTGNSNYTVLLTQGGEPLNFMILFDTNGCVIKSHGEGMNPDNVDKDIVCSLYGPQDDQIAWMKSSAESAFASLGKHIPVSMFFHIPPMEVAHAVNIKYPEISAILGNSPMPFRPDLEGDLGEARELYGGFSHPLFWSTAKEIGVTDMFMGHQHKIATSIVYDGIRLTYGQKTGTYDYYHHSLIGSTLATLSEEDGSFAIAYFKFGKK